jgi:hypothetical protein
VLCGGAERRHTKRILGVLNSFAHRHNIQNIYTNKGSDAIAPFIYRTLDSNAFFMGEKEDRERTD